MYRFSSSFLMASSSCSIIIMFLLMLSSLQLKGQHKPAYKIFTKDGIEVNYELMLKEVISSEVIFFGEIHNNPIAHWLELELFKDLVRKNKNLALGLEMLEADNQLILNEYLSGTIQENQFLEEMRLWNNFKTDYRPLVEFAKENKLKVLATNIPRRYANLVYRKGIEALDSLNEEAKQYIAPLPIQVDLQLGTYKDLVHSMGSHNHKTGNNLVLSQAVKDATMAHFILQGLENQVFHVNGSYHTQSGEGIIWYLKQEQPALKIKSIQTVEQEDINKLEEKHFGKADFIICIPASMTKSY